MEGKKNTRILLIGCGRWGKLILRDLKNLNCIVFVLTKSEESIRNAIDYGADQLINEFKEVSKIDGVIVAVESIAHFAVIKSVLDHFGNIPIFVEKPLCIKTSDVNYLLNRAPENVFVMHKWRYHNGIITLSNLAKSEQLGKLLGIKLVRNNWGIPQTDVDSIWILLPHDLSIVLEIFGYIPQARFSKFDKTPHGLHGLFGFLSDDRFWVSLEVSERHPESKREIKLYFENGIAQLYDIYSDKIEIFHSDKSNLTNKPNPFYIEFENSMPLLEELKAFIKYIKGNNVPPKSSVKEGYQVISRIEELREMAKNE